MFNSIVDLTNFTERDTIINDKTLQLSRVLALELLDLTYLILARISFKTVLYA